MLAAIDRRLTRLPAAAVFTLAAGLLALIGLIHYWIGYEISLTVLYLAPVAIASWYAGRNSGFLIALLSATSAAVLDLAAGHAYSHPVIPFWNGVALLVFFLISAGLIDMLRARLHLEHHLARTDALTGILNSRAFLEHMGYIIALSQRDGAPFTLAYIDLDNFKQVNDRHGHSEGDRVLQTVGNVLRDSIRRTDAVARLGGDEFALLLPVTDEAAAATLIEKLKLHLDQALSGRPLPIACSIGAVTFRQPPSCPDEAVRLADVVMYKAKARGKNTVVLETVPFAAPAG
jgi:diguanylate cyclase (GGDEF)-like protein